jgi:hypothetical protein
MLKTGRLQIIMDEDEAKTPRDPARLNCAAEFFGDGTVTFNVSGRALNPHLLATALNILAAELEGGA